MPAPRGIEARGRRARGGSAVSFALVEPEVRHCARAAAQPRFLDGFRDTGTDDLTPQHVRVGTDAKLCAANLTRQAPMIVLGA